MDFPGAFVWMRECRYSLRSIHKMKSTHDNSHFLIVATFLIACVLQATALSAETLDERVDGILSRMTLAEKILQLHQEGGMNTADNARLAIPGFLMADGPHGVREGLATSFPVGIAMAATWDTSIAFHVGAAMGREFRGKGKSQALGPCMDLCRDPRNGRSPESGGEDPFLCAQVTTAVTRGVQSSRTIATIKHYNCKGRQLNRTENDHIVSRRNLMEHYGLNFRTAVQTGGALCVMNAYNLINGQKCAENHDLLTRILRDDWGFPYYVVSDWGSIWSSERAIKAGCDVCMGSDNYKNDLPGLASRGVVPGSVIDEAVRRVLRTKLVSGMIDGAPAGNPDDVGSLENRRICLDAGRKSIVLLKNRDGILPLDGAKIRKLALIGPGADVALTDGTGSSWVSPIHTVSPLQGITDKIGADRIVYARGCDINSSSSAGFPEALDAASAADAVVYFGGLDGTQEGEGLDRVGDSIDLPAKQQELINALASANPNLIVVLESGGICGINRCIASIKGLLYAFYPGQEGGTAIADVLFGDVNPGGRLPVTMPKTDSQLPERDKDFNNDFGCGYRWFDEMRITPQFAFGYGLSYTIFEYNNLSVSPASVPAGQRIEVRAEVRNTGSRAGDEVVQLYLTTDASRVWMPKKQLKGFRRISLESGETQTVTFILTPEELYYFDESSDGYEVETGSYTVRVGGSSDNLPLQGSFTVTPAAKKPDLQIANIRMVPPYPEKDDEVIFLATVINRGTGPSPADVTHRVSFRVDRKEVSWSSNFRHAIPAGGMALAAADGGPSGGNVWKAGEPGTVTVTAAVDPSNLVAETLEDNNSLAMQAEIRPHPPKNLALGASVTVSSIEGPGLEGANAVDGNLSTRWSSAFSDPQTMTVDLKAVHDIDRVVLNWESAYGKEYQILVSTDGFTWQEAAAVTDGNGGSDTLSVPAAARYLRLSMTRRGTQWGYSLYEFQVFAAGAEPEPGGTGIPGTFYLVNGFPNPFNRRLTIPYGLKDGGRVQIAIFDASGRLMKTLVDAVLEAGRYEAEWDGTDGTGSALSSGVYLIRMNAGGFSKTVKILHLK
jgi:beta-glucosidase